MRPPDPLRRLRRLLRPRPRDLPLRHEPLSDVYGYDRGLPVDRVYIEAFLEENAARIRGRVLEVKAPTYTRRFGGGEVSHSDVLDVDPGNRTATVVADLGSPGALGDVTFDCVVLTQTLQLIADPATALRNVWSCLAPGGCALITVPVTSKVELRYPDLWRWTPGGLAHLLETVLPEADTEVTGYGNLLATTAFIHGLAAEELDADDLRPHDPRFPLVVAARVLR